MTTEATHTIPAEFKSRKGLLLFAGLIQCLIALFSFSVAGMSVLGAVFSSTAEMAHGTSSVNMSGTLSAALFHLILAASFTALGVSTIKRKRWARDVGLAGSTLWLVTSIPAMAFWIYIMPRFADTISATGGECSTTFVGIVLWATTIICTLTYVLLPLLFLGIYRSPHVKATCDRNARSPAWTQDCPIAVLIVCMALTWWIPSSLMMLGYKAFPLFGYLLSGLPSVLAIVSIAVFCGVLAVWTFRRELRGWWGTSALIVIGSTSNLFSFSRISTEDYYQMMGLDAEAARMADMFNWNDPIFTLFMGAGMLIAMGYMFTIRKYFVTTAAGSATSP